jgi:hypothetical protein
MTAKSSYIKTILNNFASMNIENLRLFLNEDILYQDTTKAVFLDQVESIFEAHKNSGDTQLLIYTGNCGSKLCVNCGKKGYRFLGNNSKNYLDLVFETTEDDITDIFYCQRFKTHVELDKLGVRGEIEVNLDEQVTYEKTPEYWSKVYAATEALSEIITTPPRVVNFNELEYWINKNEVTDTLIGSYDFTEPQMKWSPFSSLYADLKNIREYIDSCLDAFKQANSEAKQIETEQDLVDWIVKYEDIHEAASINFKYNWVKEKKRYKLYPNNPLFLSDPIFEETFSFFKFFQEHFDDIFIKYSTYIDDENTILYNNGGSSSFGVSHFSLKYHLAHRKAQEEIGTEVPFYLKKR